MSPVRRRSPVGLFGLVGLGLYGAATALVGVLAAIGFAPDRAAAGPSLADGTLGRQVVAAQVLPGSPDDASLLRPRSLPAAGRGSPGEVPGPWLPVEDRSGVLDGSVPTAKVGRGAPAEASFQPLTLVLPGGVTAPVRSSGVHSDGSLVIPDDPATVGWWNGGAEAGDAFGGVVVAGHVDSARYGLGVMARLRTLKIGQIVELRAVQRRQRYRVSARSELPQAELAARSDAFRQDVAPRLVLITCGGAFDPARHRYQDNLILYADPVG